MEFVGFFNWGGSGTEIITSSKVSNDSDAIICLWDAKDMALLFKIEISMEYPTVYLHPKRPEFMLFDANSIKMYTVDNEMFFCKPVAERIV